MADATLSVAYEASTIAERLIPLYHDHLLREDFGGAAGIAFVFTDTARQKKGRSILATTTKLTPMLRFLIAGFDESPQAPQFLIVLSLLDWAIMEDSTREAVVDHELSHIAYDPDKGTYGIAGHDVEEFSDIIRRHGLWKSDLQEFGNAVGQQLSLLDAGR